MDPTMSEIRIFAGSFAPMGWAYCNGQSMSIAANSALFALLGTIYGGDGQNTFNLPDFQGRVPVGTGQGAGLPTVTLGQKFGSETVALALQNLPSHTHSVVGAGSIPLGGTVSAIMNVGSASGSSKPAGNFLGADGSGAGNYANSPSVTGTTPDTLSVNAIATTTSNLNVTLSNVQISVTGVPSPQAVLSNRQPFLGLSYIICTEGIFPTRN